MERQKATEPKCVPEYGSPELVSLLTIDATSDSKTATTSKDLRARYKYNVFCRIFFLWVEPLVWTGLKRNLVQSDIAVHPEELESYTLLSRFNRYWLLELERKKRGRKARLWFVIFKCTWWYLVIQGVLTLLEVSCQVGQAVILGYLSNYFVISEPSNRDTRNAYVYASALVIMAMAIAMCHGHGLVIGQKLGLITKQTLSAAIHQKILNLNHVAIGHTTVGHIINLASNDVHRFEQAFMFIHQLWISPLVFVVFVYLLYSELGLCGLVPMQLVIIILPFQFMLSRLFHFVRHDSAQVTDKRVKVINEVISGIRVIKMYAWEHAFKNKITQLRSSESSHVLKAGLLQGSTLAIEHASLPLLMFGAFSIFVSTGGILTPKKVFTSLSLFNLVQRGIMRLYIRSVFLLTEAGIATSRIQNLLELEEILHIDANSSNVRGTGAKVKESESSIYDKQTYKHCKDLEDSNSIVRVDHISASWSQDEATLVLNNITFEVNQRAHLLTIIGPVAAGKSTILHCLLGELQPIKGRVKVRGKIAYTSQDPWLFSGTLRENILFGNPFHAAWYSAVIEACALNEDISQLPNKDLTCVGERGISLSGGQKARISLARAVYHNADVYLLDDPLSAVDVIVARHIFERCICGLLKNSLVVLVTHQLQFAEQADQILVIKDGSVEAYDTPSNLRARRIDHVKLSGEPPKNEAISDVYDEGTSEGDVIKEPDSQVNHSPPEYPDKQTLPIEEKGSGSISFKVYAKYLSTGASYFTILLMMAVLVAGEVNRVIGDWWISKWADCSMKGTLALNISTCMLSRNLRLEIYGGLTALVVILNFGRVAFLFTVLVEATRKLHNKAIGSLLRAPIRFFDTNPAGRIINRFSKDVSSLDDMLPNQMTEFLMLSLRFLASVVTSTVANPWMTIPALVIIVLFLALRWYYLKTARDIKRLEAISRSPIYSQLSTSLLGLSTIRAYGKRDTVHSSFLDYLNQNSQAAYMYVATTRWFGIRIDLLTALFLAIVSYSSILMSKSLNPSVIGLSLSYIVALSGMFQYCVRLSAEVENTMVSAERLLQYSALQSEASHETLPTNKKPPPDWPQKGDILLNDVTFSYAADTPTVLKSLSCHIPAGEKVGVVGRTGAGKSSLISVLFRFNEPSGIIEIDGLQINDIGLHDLRKKISIIPQDPVLFAGPVRYNLDPLEEYSDTELWNALEKAQLKNAVEKMEGGLLGHVMEGGSNFSVGQRQLMCLARALLRRNKILIIDEATANVDFETDSIIQQALQESFLNCTILTIAHRLNTIMHCNRILVMSAGEIKEYDEPYQLLQDHHSLLSKLIYQTGPSGSRRLLKMAEDAHFGHELVLAVQKSSTFTTN